MKTPQFIDLAKGYIAARAISKNYRQHIQTIAKRVGDVTAKRLNAYLVRRLEEVSGITARNERTIMLCVWRWAYDQELIDYGPRGIGKLRARRKPTKAWTLDGLKKLIEATKTRDGKRLRSGADLGQFLRAWVLMGYETGARFGDIMAFSREHLQEDTLAWTQAKTGDPLVRPLTPACLAAIDTMLAGSTDGTIIGWVCRRRQAMRLMRELIDDAAIGGSSKWLRRSGATHCEMQQAGSGRLHLGHRSPALFEQAYCDWAQLRTKTPRTPELM